MNARKIRIIVILTAFMVDGSALAGEGRFSLGTSIGTTGISLDAKAKLTDRLVTRVGYNFLEFEMDDEEYDDISYDADLDFSTFNVGVDLHPFKTAFHISAGLFLGERKMDLFGAPVGNVNIGGQTFSSEQVGTLLGEASYESVAPFLGIGWDNTFTSKGHWGVSFLAGVIISDSPNVELTSVGGTFSNDPLLIAEIEAEEVALEEDIDAYKYFPVVSATINYRF